MRDKSEHISLFSAQLDQIKQHRGYDKMIATM